MFLFLSFSLYLALKSPFGEVVNKRMYVCMYVCSHSLEEGQMQKVKVFVVLLDIGL